MKALIKNLLIFTLIFVVSSCHDLEELNVDPNNPTDVSTAALMTGSQKKMMDYIYDNWFSGRQALPYAQYWSQRTYTEEDRYQIRESVNNNYFNYLYTIAGNLDNIVKLNESEETRGTMALYGNNDNQIAAAKILKVWLMQVIADTWGSVPYSEAFKLEDGVQYAKYDDLASLYATLLSELDEAIGLIDTEEAVFFSGDKIYSGDAELWKKFGNSLKCRLAIRLSKVDDTWKDKIAEAISSGVFESGADDAIFSYSDVNPDQCYFWRGFYIDARNDFSITKPFVDLLKGQRDTLNNKQHPWESVIDPRLKVYTSKSNAGRYIGLPYGLKSSNMTSTIRSASPNFYNTQPLPLQAKFSVPFMTYAELCFILCEYNDFSAIDYEKGVRASIDYWNDNYTKAYDTKVNPITSDEIETYITSVSGVVNAETVATQKYIHLYMCGTEAWAEYRRTGYPTTLLKPGEISYFTGGANLVFEPLSEVKGDLPARVKYPTNESTLNGTNFNEAVAKLEDGTNNYYSKMFWDVRTATVPHPANK
ncbi:MAG: SusD/RagB family nutrient-binding outer membrane lipoprotein [Breznakibacter sp.]